MARRLAAVSVVKYGLPVPAAKITTRPFSRCRTARRRIYGSHIACIATADNTRVLTPACSSAFCRASALITVASMPIWSAVERSIPRRSYSLPRIKLPAPITIASSTPSALISLISSAMVASASRSTPLFWLAGASASPESFSRTRLKRGFLPGTLSTIAMVSSRAPPFSPLQHPENLTMLNPCLLKLAGLGCALLVVTFAQLKAREAPHVELFTNLRGVLADQIGNGPIRVAHPALFQQTDFLVELVQFAVDDLGDHVGRLARRLLRVDLALLLDNLRSQFLAAYAARAGRRNLHGDFLHQGLEIRALGGKVGLTIHFHQDPQLSARMNVRTNRAFRGDA